MLQEGKGPINFTVFLTLFGEKLNGEPGAGLAPLAGQRARSPPGPVLTSTQTPSRPHLALAAPEGVGPTPGGAHPCIPDPWALVTPSLEVGKYAFSLPSQVPSPCLPARPAHLQRRAKPGLLELWTRPASLGGAETPPPGLLLGGGWTLAVWMLTGSLGLPGTDPEEAILSAFRLFDPSGKGVVNKDQ